LRRIPNLPSPLHALTFHLSYLGPHADRTGSVSIPKARHDVLVRRRKGIMKKFRTTLGFAVAGLALLVAPALAGSFGHSSLPPGRQSDPSLFDINAVTITQSASGAIVSLNSVSCNNGIGHTDNSYIRRFKLATDPRHSHGVHGEPVSFGIEEASSGSGGGQPMSVRLYTIPTAAPLTFANLTLVGTTGNFNVPDESLIAHTVNVAGVVAAPVAQDLVVEMFTPDGQAAGNLIFVGSNPNGQTRPSYLAAALCGVNQPTDTAALVSLACTSSWA
jgi:hypothetical protein